MAEPAPKVRSRRSTSTMSFGASRHESHDASAFYERFVPVEISNDEDIAEPVEKDVIYQMDARDMSNVLADSIALVVTSPPYFAGKEYEESLGDNGVPATYVEYLKLLHDVFEECKRVLEPGGRIAVNVANLGRRPYRSLSGDVTEILESLGFLLRGEVVWWKGRAAGGSCAWGTFQSPSNPVLRDVTERVVIASKGRFDRAKSPRERHAQGYPSTATISRDEFLEATTDVWEIAPESATRVNHPAPFPVELPKRLIELYTYQNDTILDPFIGSGTTAVAAIRTGRHFVGFDTDKTYVSRALERVAEEREKIADLKSLAKNHFRVELPAVSPSHDEADFQARAVREGRQAKDLARILLKECGFTDIRANVKPTGLGIELNYVARDETGEEWAFDVSGAFTSSRAGLKRTDTLWKALGKAAVLHEAEPGLPLVLLTTDAPTPRSSGAAALKVLSGHGRPVYDLIELLDADGHERLRTYALHGSPDK